MHPSSVSTSCCKPRTLAHFVPRCKRRPCASRLGLLPYLSEEIPTMRRTNHAVPDSPADAVTRREFLSAMLTTPLLAGVAGPELWATGTENGVPYRKLGRSGE